MIPYEGLLGEHTHPEVFQIKVAVNAQPLGGRFETPYKPLGKLAF
jgi:hypothetical protein